MRKICVVVGSRANYSSIKSVMQAIRVHSDLQLQLIVAASALLGVDLEDVLELLPDDHVREARGCAFVTDRVHGPNVDGPVPVRHDLAE